MNTKSQLRPNCLNLIELWAQNIALISPTMTAALIVPLMFSNTGNLSWLAYTVGTIMLLFVAFNLNQFAKRSTGTGSMYAYTSVGLGLTAGSISGWCLIWAYLFIGLAGTTGFTIFAGKLLAAVGISVAPPVLFAICLGSAFILAYKDIQVSTIIMLILEGISCFLIICLCLLVLGKHGFTIDKVQFDFKDASIFNMGLGVVVAIFSLVGFESSTAFGEEAKEPLKNIPRSIIWSLIASGLFFVFVCYTEVFGVRGYEQTLDHIDAPLNVLASLYGVPYLQLPISAGAMFSFFALALSCMNAGARMIFAMGRHGFFHRATCKAHELNETPHISLGIMATLMFCIVTIFWFLHFEVLDEFNDAGTMGAFGFLAAYVLITLAAPAYLRKRKELRTRDIVLCVSALALLLIPAVGSVYPVPAFPLNLFPYIFLGYLAIGIARALSFRYQLPERVRQVREDIQTQHIEPSLSMQSSPE
jgi:amino acid transporter